MTPARPPGKIVRAGPRPLATLMPALTRPAFRSRHGAVAQLLADWPQIVGPSLAASTQPLRLATGSLTLACAGPIALELQHLTAQLAERINAHFGRIVVERFRFVQARGPACLPPSRPRHTAPAPPVDVPGLPEGRLRDALAGLGGAVAQACLTRSREMAHNGPRSIRSPESRMMPTRRTLLAALPAATILTMHPARAAEDPRMAERSVGDANAKVTVQEYFSLTCTHCADFARNTFPQVQKDLIDTGKVRWIFRDFPLDQLALYAAMVARALPSERYEPFVLSLLTTQDRWAFTHANPMEELMKIALLAGMARETFDKTTRDDALKTFVLTEQADSEKKYGVNSTPTFIINEKSYPGEMPYDQFLKTVEAATPA